MFVLCLDLCTKQVCKYRSTEVPARPISAMYGLRVHTVREYTTPDDPLLPEASRSSHSFLPTPAPRFQGSVRNRFKPRRVPPCCMFVDGLDRRPYKHHGYIARTCGRYLHSEPPDFPSPSALERSARGFARPRLHTHTHTVTTWAQNLEEPAVRAVQCPTYRPVSTEYGVPSPTSRHHLLHFDSEPASQRVTRG